MTISAYIEKQKLLDWLVAREKLYFDQPNVISAYTVGAIIRELERGTFDWTGDGD